MSRESLKRYLLCETDEYEYKKELGTTRGCPDMQIVPTPAVEHPMWHTGYDAWGVHWTHANPATHRSPYQEPILTDPENWREQVHIPNPDKYYWPELEERAQNLDRENKLISVTLAMGPFERINTLCSFEDGLVFLMTNTEEYTEMLEAFADYKIKLIKKIYDIAKPDMFNLHDDWGTAQNLFMRPEMWREVIKPYTKRMYDAILDRGCIVAQHSCGHVEALLPDMIEIGCHVWEANDFCNDIEACERKYHGQICIAAPGFLDADLEVLSDATKRIEDPPLPDYDTLNVSNKSFPEPPTWLWD